MRNYWYRHVLAILLLLFLAWIFTLQRQDLHPIHLWNRVFADAGFVMLCITLMIGPAALLVPQFSLFLPWRRELGIGFTVAALLHVLIYIFGVEWNIWVFFAYYEHNELIFLEDAYAAANWVGVVAFLYAIILTLISNDLSKRWLGKGWKFLQQQSYTVFILVVLHTALFVYLVIREGHGIFRPVFWGMAGLTIVFQIAGYIHMVRKQQRSQRLQSSS